MEIPILNINRKKTVPKRLMVFVMVRFVFSLSSISSTTISSLSCPLFSSGLVDDTVDAANEYSKYPLDNYQLDFCVDSGWDWLPWNWLDGIGKQVMYGLYAITNFIWTISLW